MSPFSSKRTLNPVFDMHQPPCVRWLQCTMTPPFPTVHDGKYPTGRGMAVDNMPEVKEKPAHSKKYQVGHNVPPIFCFKTNRPGAWRIGGWGLRRRTRNGEYQVRGFLAPDIPNHCRQLKSFSKSSTGRETLRSGWSAVRNRSSCFPFAWLVMVVFPGGRFSQRTSFCLARCTGRLWCHPRQASRRDAACRARRDNGSHRSRRRA